jgi:predicted nucleotidyltransferase
MTREDVLAAPRAHESELRRGGVSHAGLFGSLARGDTGPRSDIDVLIRFDPNASVTLWDYIGLKRRVAGMIGVAQHAIDVIDLDAMTPPIRAAAERDAIYAF